MNDADIMIGLREVLVDLATHAPAPSVEVVRAAGVGVKLASASAPRSAIVYHVKPSSEEREPYRVTLVFNSWGRIADWSCECEAGRAKKTCKHLLQALVHAYHDGYRIEVS